MRNAIVALVVLAMACFSAVDKFWLSKKVIPASKQVNYSSDYQKFHNKTFKVIYVVDGDTFDIKTDSGKVRIRLLGVDTPETKKPNTPVMYFGPEATSYTKNSLLDQDVTILIDSVSKSRDRYGRLLCYTIFNSNKDFGEELIKNGFAYADLRFSHSKYKYYKRLMLKARKKKTGLWQHITPDKFPYWLRKKVKNNPYLFPSG